MNRLAPQHLGAHQPHHGAGEADTQQHRWADRDEVAEREDEEFEVGVRILQICLYSEASGVDTLNQSDE
jgi:hypothetical protein